MEGVFIDKGGAVVNVKHSDFAPSGGIAAQGNGVADDTAALQKAIDYAEAQYDATARTGRHVADRTDYQGIVLYFPPGRYRLTGKLMLKRPLRLLGAGYNESILVTEVNQPALHFEPRVLNPMMNRARIEQLGFEGNYVYRAANTSIAAQDGIYVTKYPDPSTGNGTYANTIIAVEACQFYGLGGAGVHGDFSEAATHAVGDKFVIDGCHIERCGSYGIRLDRRHATAYITNNHITANAGGIGLLGTSDFPVASSRILDNIIEANDGGLLSAAAGSTAKPFVGVMLTHTNFCEIRGNYFEWHLNGIYVGHGSRNISVVRNYFDGNDVTLPKVHNDVSGGLAFIERQLSPVYVTRSFTHMLCGGRCVETLIPRPPLPQPARERGEPVRRPRGVPSRADALPPAPSPPVPREAVENGVQNQPGAAPMCPSSLHLLPTVCGRGAEPERGGEGPPDPSCRYILRSRTALNRPEMIACTPRPFA